MANKDAPSGLTPVGHLDGSPYNGACRMFYVPSTDNSAIYVGDPVKSGGTAGAAGTVVNGIDVEGMPTAAVAAAGNTLIGVCVGMLPKVSDLSVKYREASTDRIILVATAPDLIFEIQEDSVGSNIAVTQVGNNFDMATYAAGSTLTGISAVELDSSDTTGTSTAQFRLVRMASRPDNALGTNCKWHVVINEHELKSTTGV